MEFKEKIISLLKGSKVLYTVYFYFFSTVINILKFFVRTDNKLILFVSYGGRFFNESPKCLYDRMKTDPRYTGYKLVWAFRSPTKFPEVENRIKIDSITYFITALKARCWITNVHIERGLDFKGRNTFYFNTSHTNLPKICGSAASRNKTFITKSKNNCDFYCVQCELEKELFRNDGKVVQITGFPKNDILANYTKKMHSEIRERLGIPDNKIVILYAPTFREGYLKDRDIPVDFKKWEIILGNQYVVWFRAHPIFASKVKIEDDSQFVVDMSSYVDNNDLMIAADILISDYSGILTEFGVQKKPMFCYAYDYDDYVKTRGLFFDVREDLPGGYMNEDELLNYIKNGDKEGIMKKLDIFRDKYIQVYGNSTETSLNIIYQNIQ